MVPDHLAVVPQRVMEEIQLYKALPKGIAQEDVVRVVGPIHRGTMLSLVVVEEEEPLVIT